MHQKRNKTTTKIPIRRKGTKYIVRASSHVRDSVPVVIAIRDMLKLAKTLREVKQMINAKQLKINGRTVKDYKESIRLFNILEADKPYVLKILPTKRFSFESTKSADSRICKVINKKLLKSNSIQLNLHDGSNVITKDPISVNDSISISSEGKILSTIKMEESKQAFVLSGKYTGQEGKISKLENGNAIIKLKDKEEAVSLPKSHILVI